VEGEAAGNGAPEPHRQGVEEAEGPPAEGLVKGPYVAETYDVQIESRAEKQMIVVDIP